MITTHAGAYIAEIVHVTDPAAHAASLMVIVAACLVAAWIPAASAAKADPIRPLRQDWQAVPTTSPRACDRYRPK